MNASSIARATPSATRRKPAGIKLHRLEAVQRPVLPPLRRIFARHGMRVIHEQPVDRIGIAPGPAQAHHLPDIVDLRLARGETAASAPTACHPVARTPSHPPRNSGTSPRARWRAGTRWRSYHDPWTLQPPSARAPSSPLAPAPRPARRVVRPRPPAPRPEPHRPRPSSTPIPGSCTRPPRHPPRRSPPRIAHTRPAVSSTPPRDLGSNSLNIRASNIASRTSDGSSFAASIRSAAVRSNGISARARARHAAPGHVQGRLQRQDRPASFIGRFPFISAFPKLTYQSGLSNTRPVSHPIETEHSP